jgi:hypothetical protein
MIDREIFTQSVACSVQRSSCNIDERSRFEVLYSTVETFLTIHSLRAHYI